MSRDNLFLIAAGFTPRSQNENSSDFHRTCNVLCENNLRSAPQKEHNTGEKLGASFARNPIYAPAELASVERGSSPAITRNRHLATIAACPHGAVIPLISALRRQAPQWRKRLPDFFSGDDHRSMGKSPIVAEIPSLLTARAANTQKLARLLI